MQDQAQAAALRGVEALEAATGVSMGSADQMEEDDEDEIDDEIDPDDEDEELAMQQPPVHDMHVSSEAAPAAGTSGRDRVPEPARSVSTYPQTMAEQHYTLDLQYLLDAVAHHLCASWQDCQSSLEFTR